MKRRMYNLFRSDGKAFILAIDHAAAMPSPDLKDPERVIRAAVEGGVDAFLTSYGTARNFRAAFGARGIILRADGGVSSLKRPMGPMSCLYTAEDAVRLGADSMLVMGFPGSEQSERSLVYLAKLAADCERYGLPLGAEMLPYGFEKPEGTDTRSVENLAFACRQGAELGADYIKTEFVGGERFREVVDHCPVPVLVLGGAKPVSNEQLFGSIVQAMACGARGVIMGRSILRQRDLQATCRAVAVLVHEGAAAGDAMKILASAGERKA